jgi:hypothetical protein
MRNLLFVFLLILFGTRAAWTQVFVSGQASAVYADGESGFSQYTVNDGRGTFLWRGDLFVDVLLSDDIAFLSNFRILQDQEIRIDLFALRFSDIASTGITLQLGQVDIPIGNLGERRFPNQNHFYHLPLMNEHLTTLCSSDYKVWVLSPSFAVQGDGVRILDQGLYDLGAKAYGSSGIWDYGLVVINGMASATGTYGKGGLNNNSGFGVIGRLAVTPLQGLTIGVSLGTGAFMGDQSADSASFLFASDPDDYPQRLVSGDVDFSIGKFSFSGSLLHNRWTYEPDLDAFGYSAEAQYAFTPRISGAVRAGGLIFDEVSGLSVPTYQGPVIYSGKWDHDVFRLESSVRVRITREALVKIVYEWTRTFDVAADPHDNLLIFQTVLSF